MLSFSFAFMLVGKCSGKRFSKISDGTSAMSPLFGSMVDEWLSAKQTSRFKMDAVPSSTFQLNRVEWQTGSQQDEFISSQQFSILQRQHDLRQQDIMQAQLAGPCHVKSISQELRYI